MATAATPKRSFKRTVASTVEGRSPRFLLGSLALAMVISLVAGLAIGVKIGENGKTTTKKAAVVVRPTPSTRKRVVGKSPFKKPPLKGTVARITPKLMALSPGGKRRIPLLLAPRTAVATTTKASAAEIKPGSHVLFVLGAETATTPTTPTTGAGTTTGAAKPAFTAKSILIISGTVGIRMGSVVSSVTPDSMTFKAPNGKSVTMSTVGAHVSKTIPATKALLTVGQHVLVRGYLPPVKKTKKAPAAKKGKKARVVKRTRVALEVVILPTPSAFA